MSDIIKWFRTDEQKTVLREEYQRQRAVIQDLRQVLTEAPPYTSFGDGEDWGNFPLTPVRQVREFQLTDLTAGVLGPNGADPTLFAGIMLWATGEKITDMACVCAIAATEEVGDGDGPMTVDLFYEAIGILNNGTPGPCAMVLTPKAYKEFQESLCGERDSATFNPATKEQISASWGSYRGSWRNVRIYVTNHVDTSDCGSVAQNFMFGRNGIRYVEYRDDQLISTFSAFNPNKIIDLGDLVLAMDYNAQKNECSVIAHHWPALSLGEDTIVVRIQTAT